MESPEIHLHVHIHDPAKTSRFTDGDILIEHTYGKPGTSGDPNQLDLLSPATTTPETPVAITPQTTHDQRVEIADYGERNKHLVKVDERLSYANSRESAAERVKMGLLKDYDERFLRRNAKEAREEARKELSKACGHCALECAIRGNFTKWGRVHESSHTKKTADQESRKAWRRRLVKDPEAHCLPGKPKNPIAKKAT